MFDVFRKVVLKSARNAVLKVVQVFLNVVLDAVLYVVLYVILDVALDDGYWFSLVYLTYI